jgi:hypothetical protein
MRPHVHDESESASGGDHLHRWDVTRMRKHLRNVHDIQIPMFWDIGRLHQAHLEDHHTIPGWTQPPAKAKEAPMTQTDTTRPADADDGPRKLYEADKYSDAPGWDDVDQEERDFWRAEYAKKQLADATAPRPIPRQHTPEAKTEERHADHRIMVDRVTAVMAGLDFDREWAADDGIGPNARGALRVTFQRAAEQTLAWLERGGLAVIPGYLELLNERVLQERDEARRQAALEKEAGAEARRQMGEQQRAMQEMAEAREMAESIQHELEEVNESFRSRVVGLEARLAESEQRRQGLFQEMGEIRRQLDEKHQALEQAALAYDRMNRQRVVTEQELREQLEEAQREVTAARRLQLEAQDERDEARDERDRAQQQLMEKLTEAGALREEWDQARKVLDKTVRRLAERTQALDEGRGKLQQLITSLRDTGWEGSTVFQRLEAILDEPVSTVTEASQAPVEPTEEHRENMREDIAELLRFGADDLAWARRFAEGGEV